MKPPYVKHKYSNLDELLEGANNLHIINGAELISVIKGYESISAIYKYPQYSLRT